MRSCNNCGATITCGCQDRIASDGKQVCTQCSASYEQQLILSANVQTILQNNIEKNENSSS